MAEREVARLDVHRASRATHLPGRGSGYLCIELVALLPEEEAKELTRRLDSGETRLVAVFLEVPNG